MFNKPRQSQAIALPLTDQHGNDFGSAILFKESIISIFYNHNSGEMILNVKNSTMSIASKLLLAEEHQPVLTNGQLTPGQDGKALTQGTKKYRNDIYINGTGGNEQISLTDEAEIRRFWEWLDCGVDIEPMFQKRKAHLEKMEQYKREAQERHEAQLKEAEAKVKEKLEKEGSLKSKLSVAKEEANPEDLGQPVLEPGQGDQVIE